MEDASNRWSVLDYLKVGINGMPPRSLGGIDVTYRCNLRCRHCYFIRQNHRQELSTEQWLMLFDRWKREGFPFMICGWIGGEPLLRKDLVDRGRKYFKSNVIFTNGTIDLPSWHNVTFSVSVHGTEEYYYRMTGARKGTYQQIKENVDRPDVSVMIGFCVTRFNSACIEKMIEEWSKTKVRGIIFEFYTPMKGEGDGLCLDWTERDRVIERIRELKKTYGEFIGVSDRIYRLMESEAARKVTRNCPFPLIGFSYDPMGRPKVPCQLGPEADCSRCGCILPFFSMVLTQRKLLIPEFGASLFRRITKWTHDGGGIARPWRRILDGTG